VEGTVIERKLLSSIKLKIKWSFQYCKISFNIEKAVNKLPDDVIFNKLPDDVIWELVYCFLKNY